MNISELQAAIGATADGQWGPASRAQLLAHFANLNAKPISAQILAQVASDLRCSVDQLLAVAAVESSGGGFDHGGRPKILFERHLFHRMTDGKWSPASFSNPAGGGYDVSSWDKLFDACGHDPDSAFAACSWGKFQVLGMHWSKLGYATPFELADSCITGEEAHYDLFTRYIRTAGLGEALRKVSRDPETCRDFAAGYNGPGYRKFDYHTKIARVMK